MKFELSLTQMQIIFFAGAGLVTILNLLMWGVVIAKQEKVQKTAKDVFRKLGVEWLKGQDSIYEQIRISSARFDVLLKAVKATQVNIATLTDRDELQRRIAELENALLAAEEALSLVDIVRVVKKED